MQSDAVAWYGVKVQVWAVVVNAVLFFGTLLLWWETRKARQAAEETIKRQAEFADEQIRLAQEATGSAARSAKAAEDAFSLAKSATHKGQRAWVLLSNIEIVGGLNPDNDSYIIVFIKNYGVTPARDLRFRTRLQVLRDIPDELHIVTSDDDGQAVLGPDEDMSMKNWLNLDKVDFGTILSGSQKIVLTGTVRYQHIFNDDYVSSSWCWYYSHGEKRFVTASMHNTVG